jgi:hypothetical protein
MEDNRLSKEEITELLVDGKITIEMVIDAIIDYNGIIGVGLISLAQTLYIYTVLNPKLRVEGMTKEKAEKIIEDYKKTHYGIVQN